MGADGEMENMAFGDGEGKGGRKKGWKRREKRHKLKRNGKGRKVQGNEKRCRTVDFR